MIKEPARNRAAQATLDDAARKYGHAFVLPNYFLTPEMQSIPIRYCVHNKCVRRFRDSKDLETE